LGGSLGTIPRSGGAILDELADVVDVEVGAPVRRLGQRPGGDGLAEAGVDPTPPTGEDVA